jgi:hypothetical protein
MTPFTIPSPLPVGQRDSAAKPSTAKQNTQPGRGPLCDLLHKGAERLELGVVSGI